MADTWSMLSRIIAVQDMPSLNSPLHNRASAVEECDPPAKVVRRAGATEA